VWSLGVVLYLILVGANPFRNSQTKTKVATVRKIESGDFDQGRVGWLELSEDARSLIKSLLVLEEEKRLTCVQSLRHQWVARQEGGASARQAGVPRAAALATPRGVDQDPAAHASSVLVLLMRFAALDPMQKVVLAACSQTISDKDLSARPMAIPWYALFVILDENGDGRIGFEEFVIGMKALLGNEQVSEEKLYGLARAVDTDGSGAIEWGEWLAVGLLTVDHLIEAPEPLGTAFRLLDRPTGDGTVGAADLLAVVDGGTSGGEFRMPADAARAQVLSALSQYSPKPDNDVTGVASMAPPSLIEDDIRRVLQSINAR
jgi:Ca2+-binding EF-hand superfamily protein